MSDDDDDDDGGGGGGGGDGGGGDYAYDLPKPFVIMMSGIKSCRDSRPSGGVSAIDFGNPDRSCTSSWVWLQATIGNNSVPPLLDLHLILVTESVQTLFSSSIYDPLLFYHIFRNHIKNDASTLFSSTN